MAVKVKVPKTIAVIRLCEQTFTAADAAVIVRQSISVFRRGHG